MDDEMDMINYYSMGYYLAPKRYYDGGSPVSRGWVCNSNLIVPNMVPSIG